MARGRASVVVRAGIAAFGAVVAALTIALVEPAAAGAGTTYGDVSALFRLLEIVVGLALVAAGLVLLAQRSTALLGTLAVLAAVAWLAPVWLGWQDGPSWVRSIALTVAPLLPAVVLGIAVLVPPGGGSWMRRSSIGLVVVVAAASLAAAIALVLVRDPLRDLYCWSDCAVRPIRGGDDLELTRRALRLELGLGTAAGALATIVAVVRLAIASGSARRGSGPALAAVALTGAALAAYAAALDLEPREQPDRTLYAWLFVARAVGLLALAGGLAWLALRPRLVRERVRRLAVDLERSAAAGGLDEVLADALGDPGLSLSYPIGEGDRVVDPDGRPVDRAAMRLSTPIVGDDGVIAYVASSGTSAEELARELGPAAHLALGNERLRAEALARLADVTRSRARIVGTADTARRRMERDLHDGAQQRMLALTYDLRVALTIAESSGNDRAAVPLRLALDKAVEAAQELRDVAHGIFPAELSASGLEAALESLADLRPLRLSVELPRGRRYPAEIETAAYAVVAEAAEDGTELDVAATEQDGALRVTVEGDWRGGAAVAVEDRVGAAGGTVRVEGRRLEALLPVPPPH